MKDLNKYIPHRSGIRVGVHSYDKINNIADLSLFGSTMTGTPEDDITIDDINTELRHLESRHVLASDKVRTAIANPLNKTLVTNKAVLNIPYFQGQNDRMVSRADNIQNKYIPKEEFNNMANHYMKKKSLEQFDGKSRVEHEGEIKVNGQKFVKVKTGDIIKA